MLARNRAEEISMNLFLITIVSICIYHFWLRAIFMNFIFISEKPHNPMINAGAIITCSLLKTLIKPEMTLAEKFDYTLSYFRVCHHFFFL